MSGDAKAAVFAEESEAAEVGGEVVFDDLEGVVLAVAVYDEEFCVLGWVGLVAEALDGGLDGFGAVFDA